MILEAGELDTRMTLQKRSTKKNAYGEVVDVWKDGVTFMGKLSSISNRTQNIAKGFSATVSYEVKCRYKAEASNDYRLVINNKAFEISGVVQDPKKAWTQLFLSESVE